MTALASRAVQSRDLSRKPIQIWDLLVWAFKAECARLDHPSFVGAEGYHMVSSSYMICQHEKLGCRIDGGGRSSCHPDADLVAAAVAVLPDSFGGWRMAMSIADMARTARVPDWRVETRVVAARMLTNRHGRHAATENAANMGADGWPPVPRINRKGCLVHDMVQCCPVRILGDASQAARARRTYLDWWRALFELRETFKIHNDLSAFCVIDGMPPMEPWKKTS